ncbi:MAG: aminotransferase class III-fold pyridoxal phosphate-dependent enzyme [Actinobacteria bacterium]|nr:aminotransferase class III-fold pyridoxal phosphate-dependent enzyme [Actinomycetota bacterium]
MNNSGDNLSDHRKLYSGIGGKIHLWQSRFKLPTDTYFEKLKTVLIKQDVLLVADEVNRDFGRNGAMFGE